MEDAPFYIVLQRKKQVLFRLLRLRAVVNGHHIYPLTGTRPVSIPVMANEPRLVITDGYHISRPLKLVFRELPVYCFEVSCSMSDGHLLTVLLLWVTFFLAALVTGQLFFQVLGFLPLVYVLFFYYLNREGFFRLKPVLE